MMTNQAAVSAAHPLAYGRTGIGLKPEHFSEILDRPSAAGWFEIHAENAMAPGGAYHRGLEAIRADWDFSVHGVGLSLGSAEGICPDHLRRLKAVVERYQPALVSEHVSFAVAGGRYVNQLAPLPYTEEALDLLVRNVEQAQESLGRSLLMENPSRYFSWARSVIPEPEFLAELARRTGCGLLVDVNNVYVSAVNLGFTPLDWLRALAEQGVTVGEIHLAGHSPRQTEQGLLLIDDHGSPVCDAVWTLYQQALALFGPTPTLIEWDSDIPPLAVLEQQARKATLLAMEECNGPHVRAG
jgi:uncharacterized protein (UPF0276 family)